MALPNNLNTFSDSRNIMIIRNNELKITHTRATIMHAYF